MIWMATLSIGLFVVVGLFHWVVARAFADWLVRGARQDAGPHRESPPPRVAVLVAVRGRDPSLATMLQALAEQSHPQFEVHVVVDGDAADLKQLVASGIPPGAPSVSIHELRNPPATCGLKCAALLQGLERVSPACEHLAFIDTDVVPPPQWLEFLTRPLADPTIGLVTGLQWYEPPSAAFAELGSWARALWNALAFVPTAWFGNPWAGSWACRRADFERAQITSSWRRSIVDDGPLKRAFGRLGLSVRTQRGLILVNRERCSLGSASEYMRRSLTWSRWYDDSFWTAGLSGVLAAGMVGLWTISGMWAVAAQSWFVLMLLVIGLAAGLGCTWMAFLTLRSAVHRARQIGAMESEPLRSGVRATWRHAWLIGWLHVVFVWAVWQAYLSRQIAWRGVRYHIAGPYTVSREDHPPVDGGLAPAVTDRPRS